MTIHDVFREAIEHDRSGRSHEAVASLETVADLDDPFTPWIWYHLATIAERIGDTGRFLSFAERFAAAPSARDGGFRTAHIDLLVKRIVTAERAGRNVAAEVTTLMAFEPTRYEVDLIHAAQMAYLLPQVHELEADEVIRAPWGTWTDYARPTRVGAGHYAVDTPLHHIPSATLRICRDVQYATTGRDSAVFRGLARFAGLGSGPSMGQTLHYLRQHGDPVRLRGRGLILSDRFTGDNYAHWTMDWVPRALLAREFGGGFEWLFIRGTRKPFQLQWLSRLGIDPYRVIFEDGVAWYHLDEVIYADSGLISESHPAYGGHPEIVRRIRRAAGVDAVPPAAPGLKVFISRADGGGRGIINEAAVLDLLHRHDFRVVSLSALSLDEQIALFAAADMVVGVHGAGLTNIVYLRPGARVIELLHHCYGTKSFSVIALANGLRYAYLTCAGHEGEAVPAVGQVPANPTSFVTAPIWVDVEQLAAQLRAD